jgi:hypothetical protein
LVQQAFGFRLNEKATNGVLARPQERLADMLQLWIGALLYSFVLLACQGA